MQFTLLYTPASPLSPHSRINPGNPNSSLSRRDRHRPALLAQDAGLPSQADQMHTFLQSKQDNFKESLLWS
jgi:hypothetical protein